MLAVVGVNRKHLIIEENMKKVACIFSVEEERDSQLVVTALK